MRPRDIIGAAALGLVIFAAYLSAIGVAWPRDLDGRYAGNPLKPWFDKLASRKGLCCSMADGRRVDDVDWDTQDGSYRVRVDGQWIVVPDEAVITEPNKAGFAVVWPITDADGKTQIKCFIAGTES